MLEQLFGSSSRSKIIKYFCTHDHEPSYVRQLSRTLDIKLNALSRELDNLTRMGFLVSNIDAGKKYYRVDTAFPLLTELKALIVKSIVLLERAVVRDLTKLKGVQLLVLTGLFVNKDTGTDILLVGAINRVRVQKIINAFSRSFHQNLRFTVFSSSEYRYRLEVTDKFVHTILNMSPIVIISKLSA